MSFLFDKEALCKDLAQLSGLATRVESDVPACNLTTFKLGGQIPCVVRVSTIDAIQTVVSWLSKMAVPWRIIGAGSNILVPDSGISDVVLSLSSSFALMPGMNGIVDLQSDVLVCERLESLSMQLVNHQVGDSVKLFFPGRALLIGLSRVTAQLGLAGLEFAAGIPASLGGAIKMNAGAHGSSISNVVNRVLVLKPNGELEVRKKEKLGFAYRESMISSDEIVLGVELELLIDSAEEVTDRREKALSFRKSTQPLQYPSAGSVFRNPGNVRLEHAGGDSVSHAELSAGALLERAGLKGRRCGGVKYSELHANWIIKVGEDALASQVLELMEIGKEAVFSKFGINLRSEICVW